MTSEDVTSFHPFMLTKNFRRQINEQPLIFVPQSEASGIVYSLQRNPEGGTVSVIRGWKCSNYEALHNEVAAALQFPYYYGENWNAMDECITDLDWLPADWYLINVSSIEQVLPDDEKSLGIFMRILFDAGKAWANPETRGLADTEEAVKKPFNVIVSGTDQGLLRAKKALGYAIQKS